MSILHDPSAAAGPGCDDPDEDEDEDAEAEFTLDQLEPHVRARVLDKYREIEVDMEWWEFTYQDAVRMGQCIGIEIGTREEGNVKKRVVPDINFSGFSSQGDGACFRGVYDLKSNSIAAIQAEAPQDLELHRIASELSTAQSALRLATGATMHVEIRTDSSSYCHSNTMTFEATWQMPFSSPTKVVLDENLFVDMHAKISEALRDFADWIYGQLEAAYEFLTSDEAITDALQDRRFDADGSII